MRAVYRARHEHGDPDWRCSFCGRNEGTVVEVCMERCCEPKQTCSYCGCPVD